MRVPFRIAIIAALAVPGRALLAQVVRDSAGIRIIENARPSWSAAEGLRLGVTPALVIGNRAGEQYEFGRVAGAARLADGRIVVADGASLTLRFFDSTGTFLKSVARRGEGPGEFSELQSFALMAGDTIVAGSMMGALNYFTGTGQYLDRRSWASPPLQGMDGRPIVLGTLDGSGTRVFGAFGREIPRGEGRRWIDSIPVRIVNGQNGAGRSLGKLASMMLVTDQRQARQPWFGPVATFTTTPNAFYYGFPDHYAIYVYAATGQLQRIIRRSWRPVRVTKSDIDSYVVEWGKRWIKSTGADAAAEREDLRNDPYAETVPAFSQFLVDRAGRLWVREAHLPDAAAAGALSGLPLVATRWSVFAGSGRWLGDVTMPARFTPRDIGVDYVLGTARDEDDVQTVVLYRLRPPPRRG